jgi:hypothetical protein
VAVPSLGCLFQAVEELVESTHQLRVGGVNEAGGLAAVDRLGEDAVEKLSLISNWCTSHSRKMARVSTV